MSQEVYTHGHHEAVLRSHTWRTAANSAAYLLAARPALQKLSESTMLFESASVPGVAGALVLMAASIVAGLVSGAIQGGSHA